MIFPGLPEGVPQLLQHRLGGRHRPGRVAGFAEQPETGSFFVPVQPDIKGPRPGNRMLQGGSQSETFRRAKAGGSGENRLPWPLLESLFLQVASQKNFVAGIPVRRHPGFRRISQKTAPGNGRPSQEKSRQQASSPQNDCKNQKETAHHDFSLYWRNVGELKLLPPIGTGRAFPLRNKIAFRLPVRSRQNRLQRKISPKTRQRPGISLVFYPKRRNEKPSARAVIRT